MNFADLKLYYTSLLQTVIVEPQWANQAALNANRILENKERYSAVLNNVPWYVIGLIHLMEANLDFQTYLGNGQPLSQVTTMVPRGRGPFNSWEDGAHDALTLQGMNNITDWSNESVCFQLETYNGFGYLIHHLNTPYLWSGTNHYISGKYVETPGVGSYYNPNIVSKQIGAVPVLLSLEKLING